jgi:GNAT superfamily N-acetyltransferase
MKDTSALFFNNTATFDLNWKNRYKLRVGPVLPGNRDQISRGLKDLSSESIRNRFLGSKKEFSGAELEYLTNLDGWDHYAFGIEEREKPFRGISIARMVRSPVEPLEAEVAITVIDEFQNIGLGTLLIKLIALAAYERKIERLTFTTLPQNHGILKLIQKIGVAHIGPSAMDFVQLNMEMSSVNIELIKSQLLPHLPEIGTFHSKT